MGCCTPAPKNIVIETTVLRIEGETCDRCNATVDNARIAAEQLKAQLKPLGVEVALVGHAATMENLADSNSVIINGTPIEEWLSATRVSTECASCGDLCGEEGVCCGAVSIDDEVHESYSVEHIRDAAMSALGAVLSGGGGSCCS
jgi:hypothetical protein